mmetsp:Transcript_7827/g.15250  ORF Transcript_7827/g.15250 Transcript_7827/m.15250 type:complete len:206 (+) Transcript_7827:59-676(+)
MSAVPKNVNLFPVLTEDGSDPISLVSFLQFCFRGAHVSCKTASRALFWVFGGKSGEGRRESRRRFRRPSCAVQVPPLQAVHHYTCRLREQRPHLHNGYRMFLPLALALHMYPSLHLAPPPRLCAHVSSVFEHSDATKTHQPAFSPRRCDDIPMWQLRHGSESEVRVGVFCRARADRCVLHPPMVALPSGTKSPTPERAHNRQKVG